MTRLAVAVILIAGIAAAAMWRNQFDVAALDRWVSMAGLAAPLVFILIYALAAVFFLPGTLLSLAGGALFGPILGTLYNLSGATLGAALAFLVARYLASDWVSHRLGGRLKRLVNGVEVEGWRFVAFVRLVPLFPFNLLNYALGLTRIRFTHYVVASLVFMLPSSIAFSYIGYAGKEAYSGSEGLIQKGLLALALLAVVAFLPRLIGALRKGAVLTAQQLQQRLTVGGDLLLLDVRTAGDFAGEQGHIAGATPIPVDELDARLEEICDYQERPVVVLGQTDREAAKVALLLAENGFADVHVFRGGMSDWCHQGFPVVQGSSRIAKLS